MADNANLSAARSAKNDEFYTQYGDIEAEMNAYVEYNPDVFKVGALIGNAYRFIRASGSTPEEAMRRVLWTLFYFVQQEHPLTQEYEDAVLEAVQAARENAAFCRGGSAANDK